ncbi:MAG: potassium transporter TrkG [Pseudomonadota bacterium]
MARPETRRARQGSGFGPSLSTRLAELPLIVLLAGVAAAAMLIPGVYGVIVEQYDDARVFFTWSGLFLTLVTLVAVATAARRPRNRARAHLLSLVAAFAVLPLMLAVPFQIAVQNTTLVNAWFEMLSALTTTGATLFAPDRLSETLHLWRALVGWLGGLLIWVAAIAILAPMNLGGYEVLSTAPPGAPERFDRPGLARESRDRVLRHARRLIPIYAGLTLLLWLGLVILGETPFVAACHAMAVMATSGISPVGGLVNAQAGFLGELLIVLFFVFALTRVAFSSEATRDRLQRLAQDPELGIALSLLTLIPCLLFLRHWVGAFEVDMVSDLNSALRALWGSAFSVVSFLSTTGFVSADWETARAWSGLQTPGLVLLGLALIGGGVATTAGGVKLLRVFALYKHGAREMDRLVHPSSVGGAGAVARRLRREGAYIAWIFFMLFALSLAALSCLLAMTGVAFEEAIVLVISSISNTGPAAGVVLGEPVDPADLDTAAKVILAAAMVLGRLETLAIIALLNREFWRR